jgi:hypothetical protein
MARICFGLNYRIELNIFDFYVEICSVWFITATEVGSFDEFYPLIDAVKELCFGLVVCILLSENTVDIFGSSRNQSL